MIQTGFRKCFKAELQDLGSSLKTMAETISKDLHSMRDHLAELKRLAETAEVNAEITARVNAMADLVNQYQDTADGC